MKNTSLALLLRKYIEKFVLCKLLLLCIETTLYLEAVGSHRVVPKDQIHQLPPFNQGSSRAGSGLLPHLKPVSVQKTGFRLGKVVLD